MRKWVAICLGVAGTLSSVFGQINEQAESWADHLSVLTAYRNACDIPGNESLVLAFDSAAVDFFQRYPELAVSQGMKATAQLMLAKYMWNPLHKFNQFQEWKPHLEEALVKEPNNPDLRFFRLSIQYNVPSILDYKSEMEQDASIIIRALDAGYWSSSPEHRAFVSALLNQL
jgi:hypothetical protein